MVDSQHSESTPPAPLASSLANRLSRNVSARRRALGLTQAKVAERLGVETETLSRLERGRHLPSLATLERLAEVLVTTMGELLAEAPKAPDDMAVAVASWLADLSPEDKAFACRQLKQCCDYLAGRKVVGTTK